MSNRRLTGVFVEQEERRRVLHVRVRYGSEKDAVYECGVNLGVGISDRTTAARLRWLASRIEARLGHRECPSCGSVDLRDKGGFMACNQCGKRFGGMADEA